MNRIERWTACLLLWHLLVVIVFVRCWGNPTQHPHWMGSLLVFSLPTVQFTWSLTVAMILGANRRRRKLYWSALLLTFIPGYFLYILCMLAYMFLGLKAALLCLAVGLTVLIGETIAGILFGNEWRSRLCR